MNVVGMSGISADFLMVWLAVGVVLIAIRLYFEMTGDADDR